MNEWKWIEGFDGIYQIGKDGVIRSFRTTHGTPREEPFVRKSYLMNNGYLGVTLTVNRRSLNRTVHRLVAQHFIANPLNLPEVNHINFDRTDNRAENLEWVTGKDNVRHTINAGRFRFLEIHRGSNHPRARLTEQQALEIRRAYSSGGQSQRQLAKQYGISQGAIWRLLTGQTWTHIDPSRSEPQAEAA